MRVQILPVKDVAVPDLRKWNPPILARTPYVVQCTIHVLRGLPDAEPGGLNNYFRLSVPIPIHGSLLFFLFVHAVRQFFNEAACS
jgi:hypothetical protein